MNARQRHRFSSGASRTATNEVQSAHEWRWRVGVEMRLADEEGISPEVRAFIAGQIESVVQLEMLLLLHADPMRAWSPDELAKELRIEPAWASAQLLLLAQRGLLSVADSTGVAYRYGPNTPELAQAVDGLAKAYTDRRVTVISLIYSKPVDTLKTFADAFRLRKDTPDG